MDWCCDRCRKIFNEEIEHKTSVLTISHKDYTIKLCEECNAIYEELDNNARLADYMVPHCEVETKRTLKKKKRIAKKAVKKNFAPNVDAPVAEAEEPKAE